MLLFSIQLARDAKWPWRYNKLNTFNQLAMKPNLKCNVANIKIHWWCIIILLATPKLSRVKNVEIFDTKEFLAKIVRLWRKSARRELFHQIVESLIYSPTSGVTTHWSHPQLIFRNIFSFFSLVQPFIRRFSHWPFHSLHLRFPPWGLST